MQFDQARELDAEGLLYNYTLEKRYIMLLEQQKQEVQ